MRRSLVERDGDARSLRREAPAEAFFVPALSRLETAIHQRSTINAPGVFAFRIPRVAGPHRMSLFKFSRGDQVRDERASLFVARAAPRIMPERKCIFRPPVSCEEARERDTRGVGLRRDRLLDRACVAAVSVPSEFKRVRQKLRTARRGNAQLREGFVKFSFVCWEAMISSFGFVAAYDSLPCQWSQWKCVLMTLMTGFLVIPWICVYIAREAEGLEWESTTITPSSVMITAALQLTLNRVAAMAP